MPHSSAPSRSHLRTLVFSCAIAAALTALLTTTLALRAGVDEQPQPSPMPVSVVTFDVQDSYAESLRLTGLLRAQHRAKLGFEVPGLLLTAAQEGERVLAGAVLGQLDTRQLEAQRAVAAADLASVEAELELARLRSERSTRLRTTGAISAQDADEARLAAAALASRREALLARLASLDLDLEKSTLRAPYGGVVATRHADPGTVLAVGAPVLRLVSADALEAHIGIPAAHLAALSPGQTYPLQLRSGEVPARLRALRADLDPGTRTALALLDLPASAAVMDGEIATLVLTDTIKARGGWLPLSALIEGQRGTWTVMRLERQDDGVTVALREAVEVLHVERSRAYVRGSLQPAQQVIAEGIHRIAAGTPVQPRVR